ncbi:hypothetical protein [Stieleria varia]|uniref:Uncharacterized protein n=1 Tax=Stieleria varia TaxID=2528005 RepID=A0A5C6B647_9BACT|nr:hypothetical protein [Stieleria varia]TWU07523.1 hypothetical protein Pla52n_00960 [Stieleria varia]
MIRFSCPACKKSYKAPPETAGKQTVCQGCGQRFQIPASPQPVEEIPVVVAQPVDEIPQQQEPPWARWLTECQQRFGAAPRDFDAPTSEYLKMEMSWVYGWLFFVPLCKLLKSSRQRSIFRQGSVVWAHIIQANGELWGPATPTREDNGDAPGEMVFSLDTTGKITPAYLASVAEKIAATRGQPSNDAELKRIGDYLEAETVRAFGWNAPKRFTPNVPCYISTTMFLRKHLPGGYLHETFLPVVVSHKAPYFIMPLPERFWSPELLAWWTSQ